MKYCVIIPDGMADHPIDRLDGRTPLEAARTPNMDRAAGEGAVGLCDTVPKTLEPGSDVAVMSVLGYDPKAHHTGRAPLEAADLQIEMGQPDWAFRCNFITVNDDVLADFSAGHISTKEAAVLIESLNHALASDSCRFHVGTGYRHIVIYRSEEPLDVKTTPPHQIVGESIKENLPRGRSRGILLDLMERAIPVLASHDVNSVRTDLGKNPADMIWLWGAGQRPRLELFRDQYGLRGACVSAVNLVRGFSRLIGWEVIDVPGATGYVDTDYAAKGRYGIEALNSFDIVLIHIEAPDEAAHVKDVRAKIRAIEQVDKEIVGPVMCESSHGEQLRILVMPDHYTPTESGRHQHGAVPFAVWGAGIPASGARQFSEPEASRTGIKFRRGHELMGRFIAGDIL